MLLLFTFSFFLSFFFFFTEGTFDFTQTPEKKVYFLEGGNAVFEWKYSVDDKATEFLYVIWRVILNRVPTTLLYETEDGNVVFGSTIPPAYVGRVEKIGQATLVIKNITFNDSLQFQCILRQKSGLENANPVELTVTGTTVAHVVCFLAAYNVHNNNGIQSCTCYRQTLHFTYFLVLKGGNGPVYRQTVGWNFYNCIC